MWWEELLAGGACERDGELEIARGAGAWVWVEQMRSRLVRIAVEVLALLWRAGRVQHDRFGIRLTFASPRRDGPEPRPYRNQLDARHSSPPDKSLTQLLAVVTGGTDN